MTEFDSDPWLFSEGGFTAAPVEIVNLAGGAVTETLVWREGCRSAACPPSRCSRPAFSRPGCSGWPRAGLVGVRPSGDRGALASPAYA
jgi:hypothetical protein